MIGLLHEDIWGVIVREHIDDTTILVLPLVSRQLRDIVYNHYYTLKCEHTTVTSDSVIYQTVPVHCRITRAHLHTAFDVQITDYHGNVANCDIVACQKCIDRWAKYGEENPGYIISPVLLRMLIHCAGICPEIGITWPRVYNN